MGELKIYYSNKKVISFGEMKLLKEFIDQATILEDLKSVDIFHNGNPMPDITLQILFKASG